MVKHVGRNYKTFIWLSKLMPINKCRDRGTLTSIFWKYIFIFYFKPLWPSFRNRFLHKNQDKFKIQCPLRSRNANSFTWKTRKTTTISGFKVACVADKRDHWSFRQFYERADRIYYKSFKTYLGLETFQTIIS